MKFLKIVNALAALLLPLVSAFPHLTDDAARLSARDAGGAKAERHRRASPDFDAAAQLIDVSGAHAFKAPNIQAGDLRGPCPGLNALANHNYLPHNGWATISQLVTAVNQVYGMGIDLATFLAIFGTVVIGNPLSITPGWSIGGPPHGANTQNVLGNLFGLVGTPQGLSNSHDQYESDASPTRGDLYQYGNDYELVVSQFQTMFDLQPVAATANYNMEVIAQLRSITFERSISQNPYFFYGAFTGIGGSSAAHTLIYRLFANKSAENPDGILNQDVLKSFFGVSGQSGSFVWTPGYEQIPNNWYKRAIGDEYTIAYAARDILYLASQYPNVISTGGNTGTVNSYTPVNYGDFTGGIFTAPDLLDANNLTCFLYQAALLGAPDFLRGKYSDITVPLAMLNQATNNALDGLTCPQLQSINSAQLETYPGYYGPPAASGGGGGGLGGLLSLQ